MIIKNCGKKLSIIAFSFQRQPTYIQPLAPSICSMLFQGVIPATCSTIAQSMVTALAYFIKIICFIFLSHCYRLRTTVVFDRLQHLLRVVYSVDYVQHLLYNEEHYTSQNYKFHLHDTLCEQSFHTV